MNLSLLVALDPRKLNRLRSESHSELKNELMITVLGRIEWFVIYRKSLKWYRENGGVAPVYPSIEVDRIETLVDQLIRSAVDSNYKR